MKNIGLLVAFAGGAIVGAALGLMLAPEEGSKTRNKLMGYASQEGADLKKKIKKYLDAHGIKFECCQLDEMVDNIINNDQLAKK